MRISLGTDHAGFHLKKNLVDHLRFLGHEVIDHGSYDLGPVDFPDISRAVCYSILKDEADRGILLCGTGLGAAMAANKIPGIRAGVCHDYHSAHQGVEHDNMNVLCVGGQIIGWWLMKDIVEAFLKAEFSTDEDLRRRVRKLGEMELEAVELLKDRNKESTDDK
jgi:ribose 5-phosphate isomerase B